LRNRDFPTGIFSVHRVVRCHRDSLFTSGFSNSFQLFRLRSAHCKTTFSVS